MPSIGMGRSPKSIAQAKAKAEKAFNDSANARAAVLGIALPSNFYQLAKLQTNQKTQVASGSFTGSNLVDSYANNKTSFLTNAVKNASFNYSYLNYGRTSGTSETATNNLQSAATAAIEMGIPVSTIENEIQTGAKQFGDFLPKDDFLTKVASVAAPLAMAYFLPQIGSSLGSVLLSAGVTTSTAAAAAMGTALASISVQIAKGASFEDALKNAATNAAITAGTNAIAGDITAAVDNPDVARAIINAGVTAAKTIVSGGSFENVVKAAFTAGGTSLAVDTITGQFDGYKTLPVPAKNAIKTTLAAKLNGKKDITAELVAVLVDSGVQAVKNVSTANEAAKKELGRDLTSEESDKFAWYTAGSQLNTDVKNLVVGEKSAKAIESGQSSYTYDNKPVAVSSTDLNNYFKGKLTDAGLTPTAADISEASTAYGKSKDAAGATNAVVDSRTLNEKEVKDIYAKEGVTNPTADMIAKYVKSNVDAATIAADAQKEIDANSTNLDESNAYLKSILGRNPTAKEAAAFVGNKPDEANLTRDNAYTTLVDLFTNPQNNPVKAGPGVDVAATSGAIYNATEKEIADLKAKGIDLPKINDSWSPVMLSPEDDVLQDINIYADRKLDPLEEVQLDVLLAITERNPVFKEELLDIDKSFEEQGYVPTIEELINIVNQTNGKSKEETKTAVTNYVNANTVTKDEAKQRLIDNGISKPTDEQINQFVKKENEADAFKKINEYANPLSVTEKESEQLLKDAGIANPTKEQIAMFTKEGSQADTQKALIDYANPLVTTDKEVRGMFAQIGYANPTDEEVARYTGEKPESVQLDMAKTYGAAALATKQYVDPLNAQIQALQAATKAAAEKAAADKIVAAKAAAAKKVAVAKQGTQQSTDAFNQFSAQNKQMIQAIPTLADVHFYGKDFGTQRQKLTPEGELVAPKPAQVAQDNVSGENDVSSLLQQLMAQGDSASESDLRDIVGGGGYG